MSCPETFHLEIWRFCSTEAEEFTILNADGTPYDLTGKAIYAEGRTEEGVLLIDFNPTITDAAAGQFEFPAMTPAQTEALTAGEGFLDIVVETIATGERDPQPYAQGCTFEIKTPNTREATA
jgi:hypothetical protein